MTYLRLCDIYLKYSFMHHSYLLNRKSQKGMYIRARTYLQK